MPLPVVSGNLAPDDSGPIDRHHRYVLQHDGTQNDFVWIPRFPAWQLIQPLATGQADKPVG